MHKMTEQFLLEIIAAVGAVLAVLLGASLLLAIADCLLK